MKMIIVPNIQSHLIKQGFLNILKFMKEEGEGEDPNNIYYAGEDYDGCTPLHTASRYN
jgi:hypothetical protein